MVIVRMGLPVGVGQAPVFGWCSEDTKPPTDRQVVTMPIW
jgi:hypothetical protein